MLDHRSSSIDWHRVWQATRDGLLYHELCKLPRARWAERDLADGFSLLHHAARGNDVAAAVALLQSGLVDVNARTRTSLTAAHLAALSKNPAMLEVLCAAGADMRAQDDSASAPLEWSVRTLTGTVHLTPPAVACVRVLAANGVRLTTVKQQYANRITPELWAFERGVLRCRAAAVVLLGLKRRRGDVMRALDRWVVRELCLAVWSTRTHKAWSVMGSD